MNRCGNKYTGKSGYLINTILVNIIVWRGISKTAGCVMPRLHKAFKPDPNPD